MFTLPPELRNEMYKMVMNDVYKGPELRCRPVADFSLRQPALAQVNHQLRREVLPMWYSERSFGIRIYPRFLSQIDQVWHDFKTRFEAHTDGEDGSNFLSFIKCLEVELWHPIVKDDRCPIPLLNCNGIYLKFGHTDRLSYSGHRVGDASTDWNDRDAVRALLEIAIVRNRFEAPTRLHTAFSINQFKADYPFERLVDLVVIIATKCKAAAQVVHVKSSLGLAGVDVR